MLLHLRNDDWRLQPWWAASSFVCFMLVLFLTYYVFWQKGFATLLFIGLIPIEPLRNTFRTYSSRAIRAEVIWHYGNWDGLLSVYVPKKFLGYMLSAGLFGVRFLVGVSWCLWLRSYHVRSSVQLGRRILQLQQRCWIGLASICIIAEPERSITQYCGASQPGALIVQSKCGQTPTMRQPSLTNQYRIHVCYHSAFQSTKAQRRKKETNFLQSPTISLGLEYPTYIVEMFA